MHELGVVMGVVKQVEEFARAHNVTKIDTLVLQIGELSSMIPRYVESCYPAAVDGTMMEETKLRIERLPGNALCRDCNRVYRVLEHQRTCPVCGQNNTEIISGKEFLIKEIIAC